ncbi:MAG: hypothetical protein KDD94_07470 [Calditrichaeota bacterium]|nr:hypothetical protein [Calditrichota bacterium]
MFRLISLMFLVSVFYSQFSLRAGMIFPSEEHAKNLVSFGGGYTLLENEKMPLNIIAEYSFADELTVIEFGPNLMFGLNEHIFLQASALYSRESSHGISHSDIAVIVGAAYELNHHLGIELLYGINGDIKGPRIGLSFRL